MLLNILQHAGHPPQKKCPALHVIGAEVEKPCSVESRSIKQKDQKIQNREDLSFWR